MKQHGDLLHNGYQTISLAQEFMTAWNSFIANPAQGLPFSVNAARWKRVPGASTVTVEQIVMILQSANSATGLTINISQLNNIEFRSWNNNQSTGLATGFNLSLGMQNLNLTVTGGQLPSDLQNIILVVQYQVLNS
ncbi:MAG TPA: hypothetical protein VFN30_14185 [Chitinophagaceae bacterium]|nr:hypothetical protein [Chitinophagaceae bacterium]